MHQPPHQQVVRWAYYVVLGAASLATALVALTQASQLIAPRLTYVGTAIIAVLWLGLELFLASFPVRWRAAFGTVRIRSLRLRDRAAIASVLLLLWLPRLIGASTDPSDLQEEPTLTRNDISIQSSTDFMFSVQANRGWQDTQLRISPSKAITISQVSGSWTWTSEFPEFGAEGDPRPSKLCGSICDMVAEGVRPVGSFCPDYGIQIGALIGKVGESEVFFIGPRRTYTVPIHVSSGERLYLRMNDCDTGLYDNAGAIGVRIEVSE